MARAPQGIPLCPQFVSAPPLASGLAILAWIRQANGDPGGASEAMGQAERAAPGPGVTVLFNPVPVRRAPLPLAHGDPSAAARWARPRGPRPDDRPGDPRGPGGPGAARGAVAPNPPPP